MLRHAVGTRLLTDADALGIAANEVQHFRRHQLAIEDHLGLLDLLQPLEGQQTRITRASTHQHDFTALLLGMSQLIRQPGAATGLITALQQGRQAGRSKSPLPVATALANGVKGVFHLAAQLP